MSPLSSMGVVDARPPSATKAAAAPPAARPSGMDLGVVPRVTTQASTTVVDGTTVVYDERAHNLVVLNASAGSVWACCDGTRPVADIAANLAVVRDAPLEVVRADVWSTVCKLTAEGLLTDARAAG